MERDFTSGDDYIYGYSIDSLKHMVLRNQMIDEPYHWWIKSVLNEYIEV